MAGDDGAGLPGWKTEIDSIVVQAGMKLYVSEHITFSCLIACDYVYREDGGSEEVQLAGRPRIPRWMSKCGVADASIGLIRWAQAFFEILLDLLCSHLTTTPSPRVCPSNLHRHQELLQFHTLFHFVFSWLLFFATSDIDDPEPTTRFTDRRSLTSPKRNRATTTEATR